MILFALALLVDASLADCVRADLAAAGQGPRYGIVVADEAGREIVAIDPDGRYVPASNAKILTTVAAYATLAMDAPDTDAGIGVRIDGDDVVLVGHGDARASSAADCVADCLGTLADAVAARTRRVRTVVGDDTALPDERWPSGMSWNTMATRSGTAISALTLDDNELMLTVTPGKPIASVGYYRVDDRTRIAPGPTSLSADRMPGSDVVRVEGTIAAGAAPATLRIAIEDPAHYAAWTFAAMLRARGIRVGGVAARHRTVGPGDDPTIRGTAPPPRPPAVPDLARLIPDPLAADVTVTNKTSQNLHAELLLRRMGRIAGTGSVADGLAVVRHTADAAGVPRTAWDLADGSGMSSYDRVSSRGMVTLLRWVQRQPWGAAWFATLPVGGVDGTLARRFRDTPLAGKVTAKTGSLNATNALAGMLIAASGRTLTFAAYANDVPESVAASRAIDAALVTIAAAN